MKRREFLATSTGAALTVQAPSVWLSRARVASYPVVSHPPGWRGLADPPHLTTLRDPRVRALALSAIDAARSAGAYYADVRLTNTIIRSIDHGVPTQPRGPGQLVDLGVSVRALVNGYWGWAATPTLSADEAVRVARLAVQLATQAAATSAPRAVDLVPTPVVSNDEWMTSVKIDPFGLDPLEVQDWLYGTSKHLIDLSVGRGASTSIAWAIDNQSDTQFQVQFGKQERLFASTEGTLVTQTVVTTAPLFSVPYRNAPPNGGLTIPYFNHPVQAGWERIVDTPVVELFRREMDRADANPYQNLPTKPLEIGRYDVVFGVDTVAQLLGKTLGTAAEVDRALGYWANSDGTSYLGPDPLAKLGTSVASPLVTVMAERSHPLGLATAKWDDEGVPTEDFTLVKDGILVDYHTTREQATWLAPWYQKHGHEVRSHACAMAPDALNEPLQHTPNLVLQPGPGTATEESLVRDLEHGVYVPAIFNLQMDWQCKTGMAVVGGAIEIKRGRPVSNIGFLAIMFDAMQLWKDVQALGGPASAALVQGPNSKKGDPVQFTEYSVRAVPARIKQLAIVDPWRKA